MQVVAIRTNKIVVRKVDPEEMEVSSSDDLEDVLSKSLDELGIDSIEES